MGKYIGFCCLLSCACPLPSDYPWCLLVWVTVWLLPLLSPGCFRSLDRPVALAVADHLWNLPTSGSSEGQISSVAQVAVDLLGGPQTSKEQSSCYPLCRCSPGVLLFPYMPQSPWEVFRLWCLLSSCYEYRGALGMPSSCGVFRGAEKVVISWSIAHCSADLLGCLRWWYQFPICSKCSRSSRIT